MSPQRPADGQPTGDMSVVAWVAALVTVIVTLTAAGGGGLQTPSGLHLSAWSSWAQQRDAVTIVFAVLRVVALTATWYLLTVTVVALAARATRRASLLGVARALTVPAARRLVPSAVGVGLATATLVAPAGAAPSQVAMDAAVSVPVDGDAPGETLPPPITGELPAHTAAPAPPGAPHAATARARTVDDRVTAWRVARGDHFWSIAERVVARAVDTPTERDVATYWRRLVETNRSRLPDPGNPDLLYPGQVLWLPRV